MNSKEIIRRTLRHEDTGRVPVDFGATTVTGIHVFIVEQLRAYYGLEKRPVKVSEPYQMLGEVDEELREILGIDTLGITPRNNMFGFPNEQWKEFRTHWGQVVMVPGDFNTKVNKDGDLLIFPEGDTRIRPSGRMPKASYFFDSIIREPVDELNLRVEDNTEEFGLLKEADLIYWKEQIDAIRGSEKAIVANFGGTALGDIALVPAPFMKHPKGIRDVAGWYMATVMHPDYIHAIFERQTDIAVENLKTLYGIAGDLVDVVYVCGTDFGTQNSQFCDAGTFRELWLPYYKKMNDWIHDNTSWKTFKHSCGAVKPLIQSFIDAGFDILNPVQINAAGMIPEDLKAEFGDRIIFWGGGVDTQKVLPFGTPADVERQVTDNCRILNRNGGFVFNTVHNIQANVPIENVIAMFNAIKKLNNGFLPYD